MCILFIMRHNISSKIHNFNRRKIAKRIGNTRTLLDVISYVVAQCFGFFLHKWHDVGECIRVYK